MKGFVGQLLALLHFNEEGLEESPNIPLCFNREKSSG